MKKLCCLLLIFICSNVYSQYEYNNWCFGLNAGLNFNMGVGDPQALANSEIYTAMGNSTISDKEGKLLFYADRYTVFNRNNDTLLNGSDMDIIGTRECVLLVKQPGSDSLYYLFTHRYHDTKYHLCYSIIDLSLDNGLGGIVSGWKNIDICSGRIMTLRGAWHSNQKDIWIATYNSEDSSFYSYRLGENGLNLSPVVTKIAMDLDVTLYELSFMKFSQDSRLLACGVSVSEIFYLLDFDNTNGTFSHKYVFYAGADVSRAEFSPDHSKLYLNSDIGILQYDISLGSQEAIQNSETVISTDRCYAMQLAIDGKIYTSICSYRFVHRIESPNLKGSVCNYRRNVIPLNPDGLTTRRVKQALPNCLPLRLEGFNPEILTEKTYCEGDSIIMTTSITEALSYRWMGPGGISTDKDSLIIDNAALTHSGEYKVVIESLEGEKDSAIVNITVYPKPLFEIIGEKSICRGSSTLLQANPVNENYEYLWSTGEDTSEIMISDSGDYTLTVTNELGCDSTIEFRVDMLPAPEIELTGDEEICMGDTVVYSVEPEQPGYTYLWSTGDTTASIEVWEEGKYEVTVTNEEGCDTTAVRHLYYYFVPQLEIKGDDEICQGDSTRLEIHPAKSYYKYEWSTGDTLSYIMAGDSGVYTVKVLDRTGCTYEYSKEIKLLPLPDISIKVKSNSCDADSAILSAEPYNENYSYLWSTGETNPEITVFEEKEYSLIVTDEKGCSNTAYKELKFPEVPDVAINFDGILCEGGSLELYGSPEEPGNSYLWSTGDTTSSIMIYEPGDYSLTISNEYGCDSSTTVSIKASPRPDIQIAGDSLVCRGQASKLSIVNFNEEYEYLWSTGESSPEIEVGESGIYYVTVVNEFGCENTDSIAVEYYHFPEFFIEGEDALCEDGEIVLSIKPFNEEYTYKWTNGEPGPEITVSKAGEYSVKIMNSQGCDTVISKTISLYPKPEIAITNPGVICPGDSAIIAIEEGHPGYSYLWSTGDTSNYIVIFSEGIYSLLVTTENGCDSTYEFDIKAGEAPEGKISGDTVICSGKTSILEVIPSYDEYSYKWSTNETGPSIEIGLPGTYHVEITGTEGCKSYDTIQVKAIEFDMEILHTESISTCAGEDTVFKLTIRNNSDYDITIESFLSELYPDEIIFADKSLLPAEIPANSEEEFTLIFRPQKTGKYPDSLLIDLASPCNINIRHYIEPVSKPGVLIWADSIDTDIGYLELIQIKASLLDEVSQPVILDECELFVKIKSDVFMPEIDGTDISAELKDDYWELTIPIDNITLTKEVSILSEFYGNIYLGDSLSTIFIETNCLDENFCLETQNGKLRMVPVCIGTLRLMEFISKTRFYLKSNVVSHNCGVVINTQEYGQFKLSMYNSQGQEIRAMSWNKSSRNIEEFKRDIDCTDISDGHYYLILNTPTFTLSKNLMILK